MCGAKGHMSTPSPEDLKLDDKHRDMYLDVGVLREVPPRDIDAQAGTDEAKRHEGVHLCGGCTCVGAEVISGGPVASQPRCSGWPRVCEAHPLTVGSALGLMWEWRKNMRSDFGVPLIQT